MKPFYQLVIFFLIFSRFPFSAISADYTNLIFKGCANQKFPDPSGVFSQNLNNLFSSLAAQSAQRSFATTTAGSDQNALVGLFQCRGDLTASQCYDCVSRIPKLVPRLCGGDNAAVVAARVQLSGCYLRYEVSGFRQTDPMEMLYRICGKRHSGDAGFAGKRETAFGMVENGVKSSGSGGGGFYAGEFEEVYVLGQCEGSLGNSDCEECVKSGFEKAKSECGDSISGQIYLHKCFISYSYYPHGVPNISSFSGVGNKQQHTERTVALAVGGVAALGFVIVCLMFVKSVLKKKSKHNGF